MLPEGWKRRVRGRWTGVWLVLCATLFLGAPPARAQFGLDEMARDLTGGLLGSDEEEFGSNPATGVTLIRFDGELDRGALSLLRRAVEQAKSREDALVIELATPGGRVDLMWQLSSAIFDARKGGLSVIGWVAPEALSAGALVAMSCEMLLMRPDGQIGAALPIQGTPTGVQPVEEKMLSVVRSGFRSVAERTGRPTSLAEGMVDPSIEVLWVEVDGFKRPVTGEEWDLMRLEGQPVRRLEVIAAEGRMVALTTDEALRFGLADDEVATLPELMSVHLSLTSDATVTRVEETRAEELASLLDTLAPLLLILGVTLAYLELKTPGLGVPLVLAIVCFATLLFGRYLVGLAGLEHFLVIGLGLVLIAVELFLFPGTLWAGITGAVLVVGGLIWSQLGPGLPLAHEFDRRIALQAAYNTAVWGIVAMLASAGLSWILPKTPVYSRLSVGPTDTAPAFGAALAGSGGAQAAPDLVGRAGRASTDLRPVGHVELEGEGVAEFEAYALSGSIERGQRVRVVETDGGRLKVEVLVDASAGGPSDSAGDDPSTDTRTTPDGAQA